MASPYCRLIPANGAGNCRRYLREGPVAVAQFEIEGDNEAPEIREQRALRQREVNDVISRLLRELRLGG
ncbi:MAG: hypothetical protein DI533_16860 [Cereibacter sphaeroides]|uniref:Uncharacterized protein n=1 Tax=Cereibacter sphaeroides TaxID=1063 RepID=A0A2W5RZK8_CERSP|nr:MAG: hypothetical protein DI533_16860 [Cereibacter sphaeroides]